MSARITLPELRNLDLLLNERPRIPLLRELLEKVEKCCHAVDQNHNLADILNDPANVDSLSRIAGPNALTWAIQSVTRLALQQFTIRSFVLDHELKDPARFDFIYRTIGGWREFNTVFTFQPPRDASDAEFLLLNPQRLDHFKRLKLLPEGTLVSTFVKSRSEPRKIQQEKLAAERYQAVLETTSRQPIQLSEPPKSRPKAAPAARPVRASVTSLRPMPGPNEKPCFSLPIRISKSDTFVHAGNAQLILQQLRPYPGHVALFVLRGEKKAVRMDADSIWGAEIRNGETVVFEFFGPHPDESMVRELARSVNKYTQMDKVAHE